MKFVDKIFVVVSSESQVPDNVRSLENVHIVLHSQIIPRRYLPCFNSCTIEMYLYNIKKLSERFIYFNDDIFPTNELREEDFFVDGKIAIDFKEVEYEEEFANAFQKNVINSTRLFNKKANKFLKPAHSCFPVIKSHIIEVVSHNINEIQKSLTRTRHSKNINFYAFVNYEIFRGNFIKMEQKLSYFTTLDNVKDIYDCIKENKTKFICVNDNDNCNFENWKQEFRNVLEYSLDRRKTIKFEIKQNIEVKDKIYVSFTSWIKRIQYCKHTVDLMMNQTIKPTKIILNLSEEEFPNKEKDLPQDLVQENISNELFEIFWVKENNKVYKKIIPTLNRFPNDIIVTIDDDIEYPCNFIEKLYEEFIYYDKKLPITCGECQWENEIFTHYGGFSLVKKEFFGEYLNDLYENVVMKYGIDLIPYSDFIYTYAVLLNGLRYKMTPYYNINNIRKKDPRHKEFAVSKLGTDEYKTKKKIMNDIIKAYIKYKYKKEYSDLFNAPIIVNITTWPKRDNCLFEMLSNLKNQTLYPDKIILWISEEEYDKNNLPESIQKCINNKLLSDVMFVQKNTYCHKRFECFNKFNNCYNIFLDDDILYKPNFIEELFNASKLHQSCVTVYSSNSLNYNGLKVEKSKIITKPSHYNNFMGGRCCFPPYIISNDVLTENIELRDIYVKKCDESWLKPFLIRHDIKIYSLYNFNSKEQYPIINDSQKCAVWNENKQIISEYNIREKERNFFNAIKITNTENLCKQIWENIGIDNWNLMK